MRLLLALGLAVGLALAPAACGKGDAPPPGGGTAEAPLFAARADEDPWPDEPAGAAWDACAWIPAGAETNAWAFDLASLRADRDAGRSSSLGYAAVEVRRRWMRTLGLPESALGRVVAVEDPLRFFVCEPTVPEGEVVAALTRQGLVETPLPDGARGFRQPDGEGALATLVDGHVVWGQGDETVPAVVAVRRGRAPSARDAEGVRAACAAAPKGLPVEIEAGSALRRRRPSDPPAPVAAVGITTVGARRRDVRALVCASEAAREELRTFLLRYMASRPDARPDDVLVVGVRGPLLRVTIDVAVEAESRRARRAAEGVVGILSSALESYRSRRGALPSASEGLAALQEEPDLLDGLLGRIPPDPWGRPYLYEPAHPRRPDSFVLRSLGPDGSPDTEDDVLDGARAKSAR